MRKIFFFILLLVTSPNSAHARPATDEEPAAVRVAARGLLEREVVALLLRDLPPGRVRKDALTGKLYLVGAIDIHLVGLSASHQDEYALDLVRRLSDFGSLDHRRIDISYAAIRVIVGDDVFELERVGGKGSHHTQQTYARLTSDRTDPNALSRDVIEEFRRARNPKKGGSKFRLHRSMFFDLRDLTAAAQDDVSRELRDGLDRNHVYGRAIYAGVVKVHVLRHSLRDVPRAVPLTPTPPDTAYVEFPYNRLFKISDHLSYFNRMVPMTHLTPEDDDVLKIRGRIVLRDDDLPLPLRRDLRTALGDVLDGRRRIAGATFDTSLARVVWDAPLPSCNESILEVTGSD